MADLEARLLNVLHGIAKDQGYDENNIDLKPISSGGANYTSRLFTATLLSPGKDDLKLFSKVATLGENVRSMSEIQVYETEIIFYTKIVTKFRELEEKNHVAVEDRLILPKYYGGVTDYSEELMVLEDFTAKGFKSFNRFKYYDWNYASACVGSLARLQALSVAFKKESPEEYADIVDKLKFNPTKESITVFINKSIATAVQTTDEIYRERVEIFLRNEMRKETFLKFFNPERKVLLSHGDFRPSNILHKVNKDGKFEVVLVDYQMIKQGNPVADLVYFLICGSDEEFRSKHLHDFFNHYYDTLSLSLRRLGIDPDSVYKKKDFQDDVKEMAFETSSHKAMGLFNYNICDAEGISGTIDYNIAHIRVEMLPFGLTLATFSLLFVTVEEDNAPKPEDGLDFGKFDIEASDQFHIRFNALVKDYVRWGIL